MKTTNICLLALTGSLFLTGCISVKTQKEPTARVTRVTEETTVKYPRSTTVETQTTRSY